VTRGDGQFTGEEAELMPDLLVHWRGDLQVRGLIDADGALIENPTAPRLPFGAHHPDGTLLAAGPSFSALPASQEYSIYDVAPTLLHLLGMPVPSYFDGEVMVDLLDEGAEDVRRVAVNMATDGDERTAPDGGEEVIRRRLRSLGYLE